MTSYGRCYECKSLRDLNDNRFCSEVCEKMNQARNARQIAAQPLDKSSFSREVGHRANKFDGLYNEGGEGYNPYRNR